MFKYFINDSRFIIRVKCLSERLVFQTIIVVVGSKSIHQESLKIFKKFNKAELLNSLAFLPRCRDKDVVPKFAELNHLN